MKPEDVSQDAWDAAFYHMDDFGLLSMLEEDDERSVQKAIARAIMAAKAEERAAVEAEVQSLLSNPTAVRLNWLRGGVDASYIIAEEREACAVEAAKFVDGRLYRPKFPACSYHSQEIAAAIRQRGTP